MFSVIGFAVTFVSMRLLPADETPKIESREVVLPTLVLETELNGSIARQAIPIHCPDPGVVWHQLLQQPAVLDELDVTDEQRKRLVDLSHLPFTPDVFHHKLDELLTPHQTKTLRQVTARYTCLAVGIRYALENAGVFSTNKMSFAETERVDARLEAIGQRYQTMAERELKLLDAEVRRTLTARQNSQVTELIGSRKVVDVYFLDLAILQLEYLDAVNIYDDLDERDAILGRSSQFRLTYHGRLTKLQNESPIGFLTSLTRLMEEAGVQLTGEQRDLFRAYQDELISELSGKSKSLLAEVEAKRLPIADVKRELIRQSNVRAKSTLFFIETLLTPTEFQRLKNAAMQRDLRQRGLLVLLADGYLSKQLAITMEQKKGLRDLAKSKRLLFQEIARDFENQVWQGVALSLSPSRRVAWEKEFGTGQYRYLSGAPYLLLFKRK